MIKMLNHLLNNKIINIFLMCICFFVIFLPPSLASIINYSSLSYLRAMGFVLIFVLYLYRLFLEKKINLFVVFTTILAIYLFVVSLLNNAPTSLNIYRMISLICSVLVCDIFKKDKVSFYIIIFLILSLYFLIEVVHYFVYYLINFKTSDYIVYSNRNNMFVFLFPIYLILGFIVIDIKDKLFMNAVASIVILSLLFSIFVRSLTSTIALLLFTLYLVFIVKSKVVYRFQTSTVFLFIITLGIFLLIAFSGTDSIILKLVAILFKREASLGVRARMYDAARENFFKYPVFGIGYKNLPDMSKILKWNGYVHNTIFELLINGGLIALILFFINEVLVIARAKNNRKYQSFVIGAILCLTIRNTFETMALHFIFFYFALLYYHLDISEN